MTENISLKGIEFIGRYSHILLITSINVMLAQVFVLLPVCKIMVKM